MKEIDFIPEWYKANQNRRKRYHRQYILLACLLAIMMVWSFVVGEHVKRVRADVDDIQSVFEKGKAKVDQGMMLESEIALLQHQVQILEAVSPRTNISAIIAELSWLVQDNIVLSKLSLTNEALELAEKKDAMPGGIVRIGSSSRQGEASAVSLAPTQTKLVLTGIASQGADAAMLISRLEESDYFQHVSPIYTKAKKIKDRDVIEFEIRMFVADYKIQQ